MLEAAAVAICSSYPLSQLLETKKEAEKIAIKVETKQSSRCNR